MRPSTTNTARPQAVIADRNTRSPASPLEACSSGLISAVPAVTFAAATGCGPDISGRGNAGLAIYSKLAEACYKTVKSSGAFPNLISKSGVLDFRAQIGGAMPIRTQHSLAKSGLPGRDKEAETRVGEKSVPSALPGSICWNTNASPTKNLSRFLGVMFQGSARRKVSELCRKRRKEAR